MGLPEAAVRREQGRDRGELGQRLEVHAHAFSESAKSAIEEAAGSVTTLERTDRWTSARPRSRRLPINREMKLARVGKVGAPTRKQALAGSAPEA